MNKVILFVGKNEDFSQYLAEIRYLRRLSKVSDMIGATRINLPFYSLFGKPPSPPVGGYPPRVLKF